MICVGLCIDHVNEALKSKAKQNKTKQSKPSLPPSSRSHGRASRCRALSALFHAESIISLTPFPSFAVFFLSQINSLFWYPE